MRSSSSADLNTSSARLRVCVCDWVFVVQTMAVITVAADTHQIVDVCATRADDFSSPDLVSCLVGGKCVCAYLSLCFAFYYLLFSSQISKDETFPLKEYIYIYIITIYILHLAGGMMTNDRRIPRD